MTYDDVIEGGFDDYDELSDATLPTGILGVDLLTRGGLLRGQLVEVIGKTSSGKSTIAYSTAATTQKSGERVAWIEAADNTFVPHYAEASGIKLDAMTLVTPMADIKTVLEVTHQVLASGLFGLVVLDDVQRGFSGAERSKWAQLSKDELKPLADAANTTNTTLLLTTNLTWSWVRSHPFYIRQQLQVLRHGHVMEVALLRGPDGSLQRKISVPLLLEQGVDHDKHLLELAVQGGIIEERYGRYTYQGTKLGHGATTATTTIREAKLNSTLEAAIRNTELLWGTPIC